jgi:hypothetical protein
LPKRRAIDKGYEAGPGVEFEAKVMVEGLRQIRENLRAIDEKIQEICSQFPEYEFLRPIPGFGADVSSKGLGAIGEPSVDCQVGEGSANNTRVTQSR